MVLSGWQTISRVDREGIQTLSGSVQIGYESYIDWELCVNYLSSEKSWSTQRQRGRGE